MLVSKNTGKHLPNLDACVKNSLFVVTSSIDKSSLAEFQKNK